MSKVLATVPGLGWLDRLFYCVDSAIARVAGKRRDPSSIDPSFATGVLTMSIVVAGAEAVRLIGNSSRTVSSSLTGQPSSGPSEQAVIILSCAVVWLLISYRCVFRGARAALHAQFAAESDPVRRLRNAGCCVFFASVYGVVPLVLR